MGDHDRDGPGDAQARGGSDDLPEIDFDGAFAAIVAQFATSSPQVVGPWPAAEDLDPDAENQSGTPNEEIRRIVLPDDSAADRMPPESGIPGRHRGTIPAAPEPDDDDEGFVPPEPPPLPKGDLRSRLSWAGVLGGPLFLLLAALVWRTVPAGLVLAALIAFVGGFVALIARMPAGPDDDPHNGAVV